MFEVGLRRVAIGLLAVVVVGCAGSSQSSSNADPPTFSAIYPLIFPTSTKAQCGFCHGLPPNDKSNGNLSVGADKASAYAALVGKSSTSTKCGGKPFVVPNQPDNSLFYQKLTSTPPCGDHMPLGGDSLSSDQLNQIRSWIELGAKDD